MLLDLDCYYLLLELIIILQNRRDSEVPLYILLILILGSAGHTEVYRGPQVGHPCPIEISCHDSTPTVRI